MLQPFLENVERVGEWSLLFFGGRFSHAVLKRPQRGDFRVQSTHGGVATAAVAPGAMVDVASRIVHVAAPESLYARVDGIEEGGRFLLMELEVVEPDLFFHFEPSAAVRFAECLASKLSDLASAGTTLA
jgi:glutathione synthase/RimK-type ligase-like ATP-grasp enzyme